MPRYVYREINGTINPVEVSGVPLRGVPPEATMGFHEQVLKAYAEVEADGQYRGPWPKGFVKRVHEEALERQR